MKSVGQRGSCHALAVHKAQRVNLFVCCGPHNTPFSSTKEFLPFGFSGHVCGPPWLHVPDCNSLLLSSENHFAREVSAYLFVLR